MLFSFALGARGGENIVLTQTPRKGQSSAAKCFLDAQYPPGTRLVLVRPPFAADHVQTLSHGLLAAGSAVLSYDGQRVVFAGKATPEADWQIYIVGATGGRPQALTSVHGGAMQPALLPDETLLFVSPVPGAAGNGLRAPQIYAQGRDGKPRQLTFMPNGATDPTMLLDGRILFVSPLPAASRGAPVATTLYTINNDGTEITAFACEHDRPALLRAPRQLHDRRVAFLVSDAPDAFPAATAECVQMARPFASRSSVLPNAPVSVRSVQPSGASNLLVCAQMLPGSLSKNPFTCYYASASGEFGAPLLTDPAWDCIEAVEASPSPRPMGRLSNIEPSKHSGQILCLDINDTTLHERDRPAPKAARVRLTTFAPTGSLSLLGELPVQSDGSFMAEVPSDTPLGFEALDEQGQIVRREAPFIWVRPGENRSCVGCHAAHNRAPHNHRPLAVRAAVPNFCKPASQILAQKSQPARSNQ